MYEFGWLPQQWVDLEPKEKALVIAGIQLRLEAEAKERKKYDK